MMDYLSEGFDVARKLRSNPQTEKIPIIMLTGVDQMYNYPHGGRRVLDSMRPLSGEARLAREAARRG